jgi:lysophospholipid acyltransferase (LPLAT)-like uncharacterized protein
MAVLASQSKDGELIAKVLKRLGYEVVRGSSSRGGVRGLVGIRRFIKNGYDTAFTVDGPKGPPYLVKPGVILAAKQNDCIIIPAFMNCRRVKRFNSWDKTILPPPFSRIKVTFAPPMQLSPHTDTETIERERAEFEKYMLDNTNVYSSDIL